MQSGDFESNVNYFLTDAYSFTCQNMSTSCRNNDMGKTGGSTSMPNKHLIIHQTLNI